SHDHGGKDPHFWLDPARMAVVTTKLGDAFAKADPSNADTYQANAKKLAEELTALEDEYKQGLATCERDTIVVSHSAYGYLTEDFHIHQVGMAGVDPEAEPAPATLAAIKKVMADKNITTIFTEHLINPKAAEQFAQETGAKTAVLDPIENQNDEAKDYQVSMRDNL
ncbi:MAG: zinc ABC transporter substrate-binding protein, partial [Bowdeniella nasicola]|nr:zinc ABC transporter substrate-binding protein [Bowdeniella nasicola]